MLDLNLLEERMESLTPDQSLRLRTYLDEALFFADVLDDSLTGLSAGSHVVEVGGGCGLLSMLVAERGFRVTSFEPELSGFKEMGVLRRIVQASWVGTPPEVHWIEDVARADSRPQYMRADFAYSINVLEHVDDIPEFVKGALAQVKPGGTLRLIFPNYIYPYESHFNMPTLFSKQVTERLLGRLILRQGRRDAEARLDAVALWDGLSWPTGTGVDRALRDLNVSINFSRSTTLAYVYRALHDQAFQARKGSWLMRGTRAASPLALALFRLISPRWLPVLDLAVRSQVSLPEDPSA